VREGKGTSACLEARRLQPAMRRLWGSTQDPQRRNYASRVLCQSIWE
jgi:hypothetical protein